MLVEDEPLLLRSLARHIAEIDPGFRVTCQAGDGAQALELLKTHDIHLIITDIRMPVMEGLELLQHVSAKYPHIEVVLLSGHAEFAYAQSALRNGALDYILKPVSPTALEQVLQSARVALGSRYIISEDIALSGGSTQQVVALVRQYLREHYTENIDMGILAAKFGFSSAYLTKIFNKHEGCSPVKYLTTLRIQQASHLLASTNLSIREVGERVGYPDQFYFSNVFRKTTGQSPSVYRQNTSST